MQDIKEMIYEKAYDLGAGIVKTTSVDAWEREPIQAEAFWPQKTWPWCRNVIVIGIPLFLPMAQSSPSMLNQELYNTSNRILDNMAYLLTNYITRLGFRAMFFPRDCYANMEVLLRKPEAAFSHVVAGYYAGVGTFGDSHNLITKEYGPRVRLVSVLTDAPIAPDEKIGEDLCIHCKKCLKTCPAKSFTEREGDLYQYDKDACTEYHIKLAAEHHFPCGLCANVCPVGDDAKQFKKEKAITKTGVKHIQSFGS